MRKLSVIVVLALVGGLLAGLPAAPAQAAYPGDNGRILFAGDGGFGTFDLITMSADGTDVVNLAPGGASEEYSTWSPDGTKIAFSRVSGSPSGCAIGDIYVMNADGSNVTQLTHNEFGVTAFDPTWSPDGSEIAFTRAQNDSACFAANLDIWKMNSDGSGQVLLAAGSIDAGPAADSEPAWSPDGDRIAFRSNRNNVDWARSNQIYTMDTDGSNVTQVTHQDLNTFQPNIAPAWSPDGEQLTYQHTLFRPPAGISRTQIWRINEDGTGATAVTTNGFGSNMNPAWSPDGQRIIFSASFEDPPGDFNNDIFAIDVDGTGTTNLTNTGVAKDRPDWQPVAPPPPPPPHVENGRIIVAGGAGTGSVDLITMNPDGSDRVNLTPGGFDEEFPEWSPDGTRIAFSRTAGSPSGCRTGDVYVMNADGSDITPLTSNEFGVAAYDPTWSPDGTEIAFTREHWDSSCSSGDVDIWKMNSDGSGQVLLTAGGNEFGPALDNQPAWSPDGDRIAFRSDRANADEVISDQIYTMDPDGSNVTQVTHMEVDTVELNLAPTWSPDGEQIAFEHLQIFPDPPSGQATSQIWRIDEDGTGETSVTSNGLLANMTPEWSPDGQRILFNTHFEDPPGNFNNDIFAIDPDGTDQINVTNTGTALFSVDWQPLVVEPPGDDGKIAFVSAGAEGSFTEDIYTMNPDGSERTNLLPGGVSEELPEYSPDGTRIAFSRSVGSPSGCNTGNIWVMDADGSSVTQVTTNPFGVHAFDPTWSPDGNRIAFTRIDWDTGTCNSTSGVGIWSMDADGSGQTILTSDGEQPAWSPNGDKIAFMSVRPNTEGNSYLEIYTMNTDGSGVTKLTDTPEITDPEQNENPAWSPDGSMIAFEHMFGITDAGPEIWVMDATGGNETTVTENGFASNIHPAWSPDGQQIAFSGACCAGSFNEIYTINVDGTEQTPITDNDVNDYMPTWGPTAAPPAFGPPTFIDTDPVSPADDNNPRVLGTAPGANEVTLYTTSDCSGAVTAQGPAADFTSTGLPVTVPDNSSTTFHATATDTGGNTSECSTSSITYVEESAPQDVVVTDCDDPELATLTTVSGNLIIQDVAGCDAINLANLVDVGGDLIITGNLDLSTIDLSGLTSVGGDLVVTGNQTSGNLLLSALGVTGGAINIAQNATSGDLDLGSLTEAGGVINIAENAVGGVLDLGSLGVSGNLVLTDNSASVINLALLVTVTGDLDISRNTSGDLDLSSLTDVDGAVNIAENTTSGDLDLSTLTDVDGAINIAGNASTGDLDLSGLEEVGGVINIAENATTGELDLSSIGTVQAMTLRANRSTSAIRVVTLTESTGEVTISENDSATVIGIGNLESAGEVTIDGNDSATVIPLGSLTTAGEVTITDNAAAGEVDLTGLLGAGDVTIDGNDSATAIPLGSMTSAGEVTITDNRAAGEVDLRSLIGAGDVTIEDNGTATVTMGALESAGEVSIDSTGTGTFSLGDGSPAGAVDLDLEGYDEVAGATGDTSNAVENARGDATMRVQLPDSAFDVPVPFSITRLDPAGLTPEEGTDASDDPALIDPVAAYQFDFDVPTLNADATLAFDINVDGLDAATRDALLAALDAGTATMATRGDNPDATYQAFPLCVGAEAPSADGCVLVEHLDAEGNPTEGTPTTVRFSGVVGHFSAWAVAIVEPIEDPDPEPTPTPTPTDDPTPGPDPTTPGPTPTTPPPDVTPPTISVPDDFAVNATGPEGAVVTFEATAHDDVDGTSPADCDPASGATFPVGAGGLKNHVTTVTCTKTDAAGNVATPVTFEVTVRGARDQLTFLRQRVMNSSLNERRRAELSRILRHANANLRKKPPRVAQACDLLDEFIVRVDETAALGPLRAAAWTRRAERIQAVIGC